jgi:uncharacterized membrane protein YkoI
MRVLVTISTLLFSLAAAADQIDSAHDLFSQAVFSKAASSQAVSSKFVIAQSKSSLLPSQSAKVSNKEATASVKQRYSGSKILSINIIKSKGPPVYRVKTLSPDGVVKYVFVDGTTGDVFE